MSSPGKIAKVREYDYEAVNKEINELVDGSYAKDGISNKKGCSDTTFFCWYGVRGRITKVRKNATCF